MLKKYKAKMAIKDEKDFADIQKKYGVDIPFNFETDVKNFKKPLDIYGESLPNRFCVQPMEGCDGDSKGNPSDLTIRKYKRFAAGGSAMLWLEATAVVPEGRANPRQLWINRESVDSFKKLVSEIRQSAKDENGEKQDVFLVLQLTHSGRYSKPTGKAEPMIMHHSPVLDPTHGLTKDYPLVTDEYLDDLQDKFVEAAKLGMECGFDAIDVKSCHGYLLHEMMSAYTRENSRYGGSYENRTRFIKETIGKIKKAIPGIKITSRLNVTDGYPYPYGFGMKTDGSYQNDLTEAVQLIDELKELGVELINVAIGNPYYNPYYERPHDFPIQGFELPEEHPLITIERNMNVTMELAKKCPDVKFLTSGTSWLRQLNMNVGDYLLENGLADMIGLGRLALANPDYANEFLSTGELKKGRLCITCSSCTQMMRDGMVSGCVIRDSEVYKDIYYRGRLGNEEYVRDMADSCKNCWGGSCAQDCPAGIDVSGFIKAFFDGDLKKSYEIMTEKNKIPEVCSYTCPSEVLCESKCTAGILGKSAVPIREIQKYVTTRAREEGWTKIKAGTPTGKKAAVIGYGAAGIACAVTLIEAGIAVTVYEAGDCPGGTAESVIPFARLPKDIMNKEVGSMGLEETGLFEMKYNSPVNNDLTLDDILDKGYDAVFIGAGMCKSSTLDFPNKPEGVYDAMEFLHKVKACDIKLNKNASAAVIGGGNTAMDAATSLKREGVENVYVIYRRSFKELPAWEEEVETALEMGVHFLILSQPIDYVGEEKLEGVKISHTVLGEKDESGRARPVVLPDSEYVLPVSMCVEATGQKVPGELIENLRGVEFKKGILLVDDRMKTTRDKVYAGGDIVNGGTTVVQAAGEGRKAAESIIKELS